MGTRANIGIVNPDGTVRFIYTHWDGYPDHHGPILLENYNTSQRVNELLDLGSLSVLGEEIGEKHPFDSPAPYGDEAPAYEEYRRKYGRWCRAYGRDRGEDDTEATTVANVEAFRSAANNDYAYLFQDGEWVYRGYEGGFKPLADWKKDKEDDEG